RHVVRKRAAAPERLEILPVSSPKLAIAPDDLHGVRFPAGRAEFQIQPRRMVVTGLGGLVDLACDWLLDKPVPAEHRVLVERKVSEPVKHRTAVMGGQPEDRKSVV